MITETQKDMVKQDELVKYALTHGIIDFDELEERVEAMRRKDYLKQHTSKIWQNEHGQWLTHIRDKKGKRQLRYRKSKEELEDFLVEFYKKQVKYEYIKDVFEAWSKEKLEYGEIQKQSYDKYCAEFKRFFKADLPICRKKMNNITELDIEQFIKECIRDHHLTRKTYSNLSLLLNGIFKYAKKHGFTDVSISSFMGDLQLPKNIFDKKYKPKDKEVFDEDEIVLVTEYLKTNPDIWNLGLLLQFQTGMRIGEIAALKWEDVDEKERCIHVHRTEKKYKKDDGKWTVDAQDLTKTEAGTRSIILPSTAMETIRKARVINPDGEYVFMNEGIRIRENTFNKRLERACKKLDIPVRSTHKIRKTYGTTLLDAHVDDSFVAQQMGHTDVATTRKLYYYSNKNRQNKQRQIEAAISF